LIKLKIGIVFIVLIILSSSLAFGQTRAGDWNDKGAESDTVNANNQFAFELYDQNKNTNDNVFFSPYSILSAFEMAYEGARGKTASEIQSVFHFPPEADVRNPSFAELYNQINPKNVSYQLSTANALWAQLSYPLNASYLEAIKSNYRGKADNLDFVKDPERSRQTINSWVSSKTNNKIPELLSKGAISPLTSLILTNAVYFKGKWNEPFRDQLTQEENFTNADGIKIKCLMMNKQNHFRYNETNDFQTIALPYENDDLSMIIILPKNGRMAAVEKMLDSNQFKNLSNSFEWDEVVVSLPKFKFDTGYNMNDNLSMMGMSTSFSPKDADFTGMYDKAKAGGKNLYIGLVIHKAYVDVDEKGTEAAAATAILGYVTAAAPIERPQPKIFNADHPFIFVIVHKNTGTILFLGKVNDPTK
jgi:serpin B